MGCMESLTKCFIVIVNVIVIIIGLATLGIGVAGLVFKDTLIKKLEEFTTSTSESSGVTLDASSLESYIDTLSIPLIVIGSVLVVLAILAFMGACCDCKAPYVVYGIVLVILLIGAIGLIVVVSTPNNLFGINVFEEVIKPFHKEYRFSGVSGATAEGLIMDYFMISLQCCGTTGGESFEEVDGYSGTKADYTNWNGGLNMNQGFPPSCCKTEKRDSLKPENYCTVGDNSCDKELRGTLPTCYTVSADPMNNYNNGCTDALHQFYKDNQAWIIAGAVIIFLLLLLINCMVWYVVCKNNKVDDVY